MSFAEFHKSSGFFFHECFNLLVVSDEQKQQSDQSIFFLNSSGSSFIFVDTHWKLEKNSIRLQKT